MRAVSFSTSHSLTRQLKMESDYVVSESTQKVRASKGREGNKFLQPGNSTASAQKNWPCPRTGRVRMTGGTVQNR